MAEGGYDPDETGTFDPNEGDDDRTSLIPHRGDEMEMKDMTSTLSTSTSKRRTQETSFMSETPSGSIRMMEESQNEAVDRIMEVFPNANTGGFVARVNDRGEVEIKILDDSEKKSLRYIFHTILDKDDNLTSKYKKGKFPKTLHDLLGKSVFEIIAEEDGGIERAKVRNEELDREIPNAVGEDKERMIKERRKNQRVINVGKQRIEALNERLSLRQRIKAIFRKYGFTVIAVSASIATVIGVIVSNLKVGLAKVAKGVGNGLKELEKKLGEILPGMIGAIASFIFRTAGEVIGFLAKNAWLLIVGLVVFAVEQFKNKKK